MTDKQLERGKFKWFVYSKWKHRGFVLFSFLPTDYFKGFDHYELIILDFSFNLLIPNNEVVDDKTRTVTIKRTNHDN